MKKDKNAEALIRKMSAVLSVAAIIICVICGICSELFSDDDSIMMWVIIGLANLSILFSNLHNMK